MASDANFCRLCFQKCSKTKSVSIFSKNSLSVSLPVRIANLLLVDVVQGDVCSSVICYSCRRRLERLEKAIEDLVQFRELAKGSLLQFEFVREGKRPKETSGPQSEISPSTRQMLPASKKTRFSRSLHFSPSSRNVEYKKRKRLANSFVDAEFDVENAIEDSSNSPLHRPVASKSNSQPPLPTLENALAELRKRPLLLLIGCLY